MTIKSLAKILISVSMLALVAWFVDFDRLWSMLRGVPTLLLIAIAVGYMGGQALNAFKWWLLARAGGIEVSYLTTVRASFLGAFVNCFGLGLVGGDLARALLIAEGKPVKTQAMASVIADRVQGLMVLLGIGVLASFFVVGHTLDTEFRFLIGSLALGLIFAWYFASSAILRVIPWRGGALYRAVEKVTRAFPRSPSVLGAVTGISLIFHLSQIGLHALMVYALGIQIPWYALFIGVPFVNILSNLPISWNGLGVRENAYGFFFQGAVTNEHAIALGALWLFAVTVTSACGGIIAVLTGDLAKLTSLRRADEGSGAQAAPPRSEGLINS